MSIERVQDLEVLLMEEMKRSFSDDERTIADPIHLSDLNAPRLAFFQRVHPKPLTDDEVHYFIAGRAHEDALWRLHGYERGGVREEFGITFRPDFYTSIPTEFKTRRRSLAAEGNEEKVYDSYIEQVRGYAALAERPAAWLWVMSLVERQDDGTTKPELRCYRLEWTPEELVAERARLEERRAGLVAALARKDFSALPLCAAWKCGRQSRTMTRKPYCETCWREFETEWGSEKHVNSKTGAGHVMRPAAHTTTYQPRCKWYAPECQPWTIDPARGGDAQVAA